MQVLAALCFLVLAHLPPLRGEVVESFKKGPHCLDFFYKGMVPKWNVPKRHTVYLCQRFNNRYHFATLYNTDHRIAIYSAYRFQTGDDGGREDYWYIEPQLVNMSWNAEMEDERMLRNEDNINVDFGKKQALDEDYRGSIYDRGHLNPNGHHTEDSRTATFTLTNVVPQNRDLNQRVWNEYETDLQGDLRKCTQAYVLVGAIPSADNWIVKNNIKRVNIPDRIWNAYCCLGNNGRPLDSGGAIALNTDQSRVKRHTLSELKLLLGQYTKSPVGELFHNNCEA
ncbi:endonuclease domain-containing 1 protein-like [Anguilla anguilla]|uniref:endonuclease domain-containing 1 protein-like n=1 Tax=Anguilla anguilla TaxID=7936 RepID=UPI0015AF9948|nr:endonuclease domain-containing 1 protein-like [Anguilla anguilla]XP_035240426.1 endonuclease domain-containing 1 protein-like [Anguilla anguilla]